MPCGGMSGKENKERPRDAPLLPFLPRRVQLRLQFLDLLPQVLRAVQLALEFALLFLQDLNAVCFSRRMFSSPVILAFAVSS